MGKRLILLALIICFNMFFLTGCWDNVELSRLAIATGIAIDKSQDNQYEISIQFIKPGAISSGQSQGGGGGGGGDKKSYFMASSKGRTIAETVRGMLTEVGRDIFLSETQIIIISEEAAKDGISGIFDFFLRQRGTQLKTDVVIAKGVPAKELLVIENQTENTPAEYIAQIIKNSKMRPKIKQTLLIDLLKDLVREGKSLVASEIKKGEKDTVLVEGVAVLKKDRLVGWLDPLETRGLMFATLEVHGAIIVVPNPNAPDKLVSIDMLISKSQLKLDWENGEPIFTVNIDQCGDIADEQGLTSKDFGSELKAIETEYCNKITEEVKNTLKSAQEKYKSDIFGFGELIYKHNPGYWEKVKDNWGDEFSRIPVKVNVTAHITRTGLIKGSQSSQIKE